MSWNPGGAHCRSVIPINDVALNHSVCNCSSLLLDTLRNDVGAEIQLSALMCLGSLSEHTQVADLLIKDGGMEVVLSLIEVLLEPAKPAMVMLSAAPGFSPLEKTQLTHAAIRCLAEMSANPEAIDILCGSSDLVEALSTLQRHTSGIAALLQDEDRDVRLNACRCVKHFGIDNECRESLCQTDACSRLVEFLSSPDAELRRAAAGALVALSHAESGRAMALRSDGGGGYSGQTAVSALVAMLSEPTEDSVVAAADCLHMLAINDAGRAELLSAEAIPSLLHVLRSFDNEPLAAAVLRTLSSLAYGRAGRRAMADPACLAVLDVIADAGDPVLAALAEQLRNTVAGRPKSSEEELPSLEQDGGGGASGAAAPPAAAGMPGPPAGYPRQQQHAPAPGPGYQQQQAGYGPPQPQQQAPQGYAANPYAPQPAAYQQQPAAAPPAAYGGPPMPGSYGAGGGYQQPQYNQMRPAGPLVPPGGARPERMAGNLGDLPFGLVPSSMQRREAGSTSLAGDEEFARRLQEQGSAPDPAPRGGGGGGGGGGSAAVDDEEYARRLQEQFEREEAGEGGGTDDPWTAGADSTPPEVEEEEDDDLAMARKLQAQFDKELEANGGDEAAADAAVEAAATKKGWFWQRSKKDDKKKDDS